MAKTTQNIEKQITMSNTKCHVITYHRVNKISPKTTNLRVMFLCMLCPLRFQRNLWHNNHVMAILAGYLDGQFRGNCHP